MILAEKVEQLQFFESNNPVWAANAVAIGLTAAPATAFATLTNAARSAFDGTQNPCNAANAATVTQDAALNNARLNAADLIRVITGVAEQQANLATVYAPAQIPPARSAHIGPRARQAHRHDRRPGAQRRDHAALKGHERCAQRGHVFLDQAQAER